MSKKQTHHRRKYKSSSGSKDEETKQELQRNYDENSPVIKSFLSFQKELDQRYDKRERLIKLSRDTTIISKRVIFQLHRFSEGAKGEETIQQAEVKLQEAKQLLEQTALELVGEDPYQFARACTGGLQEFVEAVTFLHYIKDGYLITYEDLCTKYLTFENDKEGDDILESTAPKFALLLRPMDYILGVADLTGELMRMCLNCLGNGEREKSEEICEFLREIHNETLVLSGRDFRDLSQKIRVMQQSMKKVENVCYAVHLRGTEVPKHMLIDLIKMQEHVGVEDSS